MNTYEITYKTSAKARKVLVAIRFGDTDEMAAKGLVADGYVVMSVALVGEHGGTFCTL